VPYTRHTHVSPKSKTSAGDPSSAVCTTTAAGDNDQSAVRLAVPSSHLAWPHRASAGERGVNAIVAVFNSKISLSKFYYSLITSNLLSHIWSIKCR